MTALIVALAIAIVSWDAHAQSAADADAITAEDFEVETADDLVEICAVDGSEQTYLAAIHFCHGFLSGSYHYYKSMALADPDEEFVCPTETTTRQQAADGFVAWIEEYPQYRSAEAIDVLYRYLAEAYPCR